MPTRLSRVDPNPFRRMDRYPIQRDKVDALKRSIEATTFWDNIVARPHPADLRRVQVAYGHHRLVALREIYSSNHKNNLIVRELDDASMLRIMAQENMAEWDTNALIDQETVQAVVDAVAKGAIELSAVPSRTNESVVRHAPSFVCGPPDDRSHGFDHPHPYTSGTVAEFLGWPKSKVKLTLSALELIEKDVLSTEDFATLSPRKARDLIREARAWEDCPQPQPDELPTPGHDGIASPEDEVDHSAESDPHPGADELVFRIAALLDPETSDLGSDLKALADDHGEAPPTTLRAVAKALDALAIRASNLASRIRPESRSDDAPRGDRHLGNVRPGPGRRRRGSR
jgi:hypothetical protein